jgi:two-component system sensor histidine kinase LytS
VTIAAERNGNQVSVSIADNGQGMPPQMLQQVLVSGFGKGAGVGLSNVNERLRNIYGQLHTLHIDSTEGRGTTVSFVIPASVRGVVA